MTSPAKAAAFSASPSFSGPFAPLHFAAQDFRVDFSPGSIVEEMRTAVSLPAFSIDIRPKLPVFPEHLLGHRHGVAGGLVGKKIPFFRPALFPK